MKTKEKVDILKLADEIISGRELKRGEDLSFFLDCDLEELCCGANKIREKFVGPFVDLCSIVNAKSGNCSQDCKFCAQSSHYETGCKKYGFLDKEEILKACAFNVKNRVHRFCIVTAGKSLEGKDFEKAVEIIKALKEKYNIKFCASMGFLTKEQLKKLKEAGLTTYHHNIETSRRNFPNITTKHTYDMKLKTIEYVKEVGLRACSGGIFGLGETFEDRIDMAISLSELKVDSIPINILTPVRGTPFENNEILKEEEVLRTIAMFRYINKNAEIRLAGGRSYLKNFGEFAFKCGASALIVGNMLTKNVDVSIKNDIEMLTRIKREV